MELFILRIISREATAQFAYINLHVSLISLKYIISQIYIISFKPFGAVYFAVQGGSNFVFGNEIPECDIQIKATEQHFPVVLFIMLYKVVLIFSLWMKSSSEIQRKAVKYYVPLIMFTMLQKLTLVKVVDQICI